MDISAYLAIPTATLIINQIIVFARRSLDRRQPVWRALLDFRSEQSLLIAFTVGLAAASLAVGGGLASAVFPFALVLVYLSWSHEQRTTTRTNRDHARTAIVAVLSAYVLAYDYWQDSVVWLFERPTDEEATRYLYAFAAIAAIGFAMVLRMQRKRMRKLPTSRQLQRIFRSAIILPAVAGVVVSLLQTETVNTFMTQRIYSISLFVIILATNLWATLKIYRQAPARLREEREHFLQEKKSRKRKKSKRRK